MSLETDEIAEAAPPAPVRKVRPFYWSVRRELWENRALWIAPAAVGGVVLFGALMSTITLHGGLKSLADGGRGSDALIMPYAAIALTVLATSFLVGVFYCLGALQGERRDRSILFWKSLPVSDLTTVLAKAAVPLLVLPLVVLGVVSAGHLILLVWSSLVVMANGISVAALWGELPLAFMWLVLALALPILALWFAPVVAWLLLVSAWAKRMTIVWAVAPPLALAAFERVAMGTTHVFQFLDWRLTGGLAHAFSVRAEGQTPVSEPADIDPARFLTSPDMWLGLAVAVLLIFAAARLRRSRDPI